MPANTDLINFIKEVRRRGYSDEEITRPLIEKGWTSEEINSAIAELNNESNKTPEEKEREKKSGKEKVEIYLDKEVHELIRKRAKRNMLSLPEQIEDIVRRSCISAKLKKSVGNEKLDDLLVGIFSRRRTGPKKK